MSTPREKALNRARVARWRAANTERARQQWRDYYYRRLKLIRCGIDPAAFAAAQENA